jgi:hypothetical protein
MATINVSLPSDGQTIDASDYNTPITTIVNEFNGNIDNANIKSAAAISGSKIADASLDLGAKGSAFDGWIPVSDSWSYASATTITVPSDATTKYAVGDKIKLVQSATTKYFYITAVSSTVLTVTGGTDYTVANSAISGIYYSKASTPQGFPQWFNWTPSWTNLTVGNGTVTYAKFMQTGKTVHFKVRFVFGSTSSMGTSPYFTAPVTESSDYSTFDPIGTAIFYDATATTYYEGLSTAQGSSAGIRPMRLSTNSLGSLTSTAPFTWATSDILLMQGTYEAA